MRILGGVWLDGKGPDCLPGSVGVGGEGGGGRLGTRVALGAVKGG